MKIKFDKTFSKLLSDFFLDIAKAYFIAAFITPSIAGISGLGELAWHLTRGILNVIVFLVLARIFAK